MSTSPDPRRLQEIIDRVDIRACMDRYARGIDRMDADLVASVFHPGSESDHGVFCGSSQEYITFALAAHREMNVSHNLIIANHLARISDDRAEAETYWFMVCRNREAPLNTIFGGRFLDRLEQREERWGIVHRRCLVEWRGELGEVPESPARDQALARAGVATRDHDDPSWSLPLLQDAAFDSTKDDKMNEHNRREK